MIRIDPLSFSVTNTYTVASAPVDIAADKDGNTIYYLNDALYSMPVTATVLPESKLADQMFYGLDVDPQTGNIVCLDAVNSKAVVYNTDGVKQFEFETAKFPASVVFSY